MGSPIPMKTQPFPVTAHVGIVVMAAVVMSCAQKIFVEDPPHQPVSVPQYEQVEEPGGRAQWRACTPPGCQAHTPKTLASSEPTSPAGDIPASSQDDEEALVSEAVPP
jgi:hypothetical protein